jgi:hypothetical protein
LTQTGSKERLPSIDNATEVCHGGI